MSEQIGKYEIVERIGRGGMGTVYKAHDPILDRMVALKVISSEGDVSEELKARFYREAQACAKLSHPNIVVVHDLGEDGGKLFIVMEFLDGQELKDLIEKKALTLENKLGLMVQVCDGLAFAHQKGIIHRDIKPGNIFVLRNGQVKILDFGIARLAVGTDPGLTRTGFIMGTIRYMSPEQARGKVDHRSDIFSVGAVFYELLASRPAFDSPDTMEILEKIRAEQPPPLVELDATIPPELATIVERALRKDPGQRFQDLGQMRVQIEGVRRGFSDEGDRLEGQVRAQLERLRSLQTALGRQLGQSFEDETIPVPTDRTGLDDLRALARELAGRIDALQARLRQAESLEPTVARGLELLKVGQAAAAVPELERVVRELPEHARAQEALQRARSAATPSAAPAPTPSKPAPAARPAGSRPEARPPARSSPAAVRAPAPAAPRASSRRGLAVAGIGALLVLGVAGYFLYPSNPSTPTPDSTSAPSTPAPSIPAPPAAGAPTAPPAPSDRTAAETLRKNVQTARESAAKVEAERLAPGLWAPAAAKEREAEAALGRQDFAAAQAAYRDAQQAYERAAAQAQQAVVLVAREFEARRVQERAVAARRAAEQADAAKLVPPLWAKATGVERDAEAALKRQEFDRAGALWGEAEQGFREAARKAAERPKTAALPSPPATPPPIDDPRLRQEVERLRASVASSREQALRSSADRLAKELFDGARGKETEAAGLEAQQQFAAASQAYQDAAQRYGESVSRARIARVAQSEADQARTRMLAEKQRARPDAGDFRAGVEEEQRGDAQYQGAAFKEATAHFQMARTLFTRAAGSATDARGAAGDPRAEIRAVLDRYKQATETRDPVLLRQVRPGLSQAEARRIEQVKSHQLDLSVESIDVNGDEAQARGRRTDVVVTRDGRTFRNEGPVVFKLRRGPSGWAIEAVD